MQINRHSCYSDRYQLYLPVEISGPIEFHLLGAWMADKRRIPAGTNNEPKDAVEFYRDFLMAKPSVVAGDFNFYIPKSELGEIGLMDADDMLGRQTHYHKRKLDSRPIRVDYVFGPEQGQMRLSRLDVGQPQPWLGYSDHVPLVADFETGTDMAARGWWASVKSCLRHAK